MQSSNLINTNTLQVIGIIPKQGFDVADEGSGHIRRGLWRDDFSAQIQIGKKTQGAEKYIYRDDFYLSNYFAASSCQSLFRTIQVHGLY